LCAVGTLLRQNNEWLGRLALAAGKASLLAAAATILGVESVLTVMLGILFGLLFVWMPWLGVVLLRAELPRPRQEPEQALPP
jgi:hypothetical protein